MLHRIRERFGAVRVSTAYEFFTAVKENLHLDEKAYLKRENPPMEATSYLLFYVAANATDAEGKEHSIVLDRLKDMWNCTGLKGSSSAYEFVGLPEGQISMRYLPCPCESCCSGDSDRCTNKDFVGEQTVSEMTLVECDCPELLHAPIGTNHTNAVLEAFIKMHHVKLPRSRRKDELVKTIVEHLSEYIVV